MSNLQEIETKIKQLPNHEIHQLAKWLNNYVDDLWDQQMEIDLNQGKLDQIIAKVEADIFDNKIKELDEVLYFTTPDFWESYRNLSPQLKQKVRKAYQLWSENSSHPSLNFKKVGKNLWSVRITNDYRALAIKKGDDYYWFWVGNHNQYDNILN